MVFLMISWFARFKNRFGKLQKNMKKRVEKVMQKTLENLQKTSSKMNAKTIQRPSKKRCEKNVEKRASGPVNPGPPAAPVRGTKRPIQKDNQRKTT